MALWNKVVSGFDREEETVNFGVRTVAENNGSLYETSTLATIQSTGKVFNINFILIVKIAINLNLTVATTFINVFK